MPHILMVLASNRFRDCEYITPRAFFEQHGCTVTTTSSSLFSRGRFGFEVHHSLLLENVHVRDFDGIYFVGGAGSTEFMDNEKAKALTEAFYVSGKPIAAICAAPRNFLHWGLLKNKKSTGHNGDGQFTILATLAGSIPEPEKTVIVDGGILTANGPEASEESALEFLAMFSKK